MKLINKEVKQRDLYVCVYVLCSI